MASREKAGEGKPQKQAKKTKDLDEKVAQTSHRDEHVKPSDDRASFSSITGALLRRVVVGAPWMRICFVGVFVCLMSAVWSLLGWLMVIGGFVQLLTVVFFPVHLERISLILRPLLLFWYELIQYVWCLRERLPEPILGLESWVQKVIDHQHKK